MKYLIRRVTGGWDEVNKFVFDNRKFAVDDNGEKLYSDTVIVSEGSSLSITGTVGVDELAKVLRYLGVQTLTAVGTYAAIVTEPETVQIIKGRSHLLHMLKTGRNWTTKIQAKPKEAAAA